MVRLIHVDAFTERPFAGNPAAVCLLDGEADAGWMQRVAAEMNLPATAFVRLDTDGFALRWFAPHSELAFCGHGTLAAAHALVDAGVLAPDQQARFATRAGALAATREDGWIALDLPAEPATAVEPPEELLRALGATPRFTGRNRFDYLVALDSEAAVRTLAPDLNLLRAIPTRGVIVTARADTPGYDIVSRFFAPGAGIAEDPVTGSAHCALGPFWRDRLQKDEVSAYQAAARGGHLRVRPQGERVTLLGRAVTVRRGALVGGAR
jgi:PhzF family phenazine biosynthesis protein